MANVTATKKVGLNSWSLAGIVTKKDTKFSGKGNMYSLVTLKVPSKNPKFNTTLFLKALDPEVAETIETSVKENGTYAFQGYVSVSSWEKEGKKVYSTDFIVNKWEVAEPAEAVPAEDKVPF